MSCPLCDKPFSEAIQHLCMEKCTDCNYYIFKFNHINTIIESASFGSISIDIKCEGNYPPIVEITDKGKKIFNPIFDNITKVDKYAIEVIQNYMILE